MKRGGPLERSAPLRRSKRINPKRYTHRRTPAVHEPEYLAWVRRQPCALLNADCEGRIHAHHTGPRPAGRLADDDSAVSLCRRHHIEGWHSGWVAPFRTWTRDQRRAWATEQVAKHRAAWAAAQQRRAA